MSFERFKFKPTHQPDEAKPVEFELKPLDMATFFRVQHSMNREGAPSWEDCCAIFLSNVTTWSGIDHDCTPAQKRLMLNAEADPDLYVWLGQIAGELYSRAVLKVAERKNS